MKRRVLILACGIGLLASTAHAGGICLLMNNIGEIYVATGRACRQDTTARGGVCYAHTQGTLPKYAAVASYAEIYNPAFVTATLQEQLVDYLGALGIRCADGGRSCGDELFPFDNACLYEDSQAAIASLRGEVEADFMARGYRILNYQ